MTRKLNTKAALLSALVLSTAFWAVPADAAYRRLAGSGTGSDEARDIAIDNAGNVYVVGSVYRGALAKHDLAIRKYNNLGMVIWTQYWGGNPTSKDHGIGIAVDNTTGDVYAVGTSDLGMGNDRDVVVVKYSAAGVLAANYRFNGSANNHDDPVSIGVADYTGMSAGVEVYVIGTTESAGTQNDVLAFSLSNMLAARWTTVWDGGIAKNDVAMTMVGAGRNTLLAGAHLYAGGKLQTAAGDYDILAMGFNPVTGAPGAPWTYGGAQDDWLMDGAADGNGVYFTGSYYHPTEAYEIFTVGFTAMGTNYGGSHRWAGAYDDFGVDVECSNWNMIWVAGDSPSSCAVPNPDYDVAIHVYNCWNTAAVAPWPDYEDITGMGSDDHTQKMKVINGVVYIAADAQTGTNVNSALFRVSSPATGMDWLYTYDYGGLYDSANFLTVSGGGTVLYIGGGSEAAATGMDWFVGKHNPATGALIW